MGKKYWVGLIECNFVKWLEVFLRTFLLLNPHLGIWQSIFIKKLDRLWYGLFRSLCLYFSSEIEKFKQALYCLLIISIENLAINIDTFVPVLSIEEIGNSFRNFWTWNRFLFSVQTNLESINSCIYAESKICSSLRNLLYFRFLLCFSILRKFA